MSNKVLKAYMKLHFDFSNMKKAGVYPKELKHTDYEGQAAIICNRLGLDSIYDYNKHEIQCHITYTDRPTWVNEKGELKTVPFVEVCHKNGMHI